MLKENYSFGGMEGPISLKTNSPMKKSFG